MALPLPPPQCGVSHNIWEDSETVWKGNPGACLGMNRLSINCWGGRRTHKEKISFARIRVFGQKVGAEVSSSGLCEEGQRRI